MENSKADICSANVYMQEITRKERWNIEQASVNERFVRKTKF